MYKKFDFHLRRDKVQNFSQTIPNFGFISFLHSTQFSITSGTRKKSSLWKKYPPTSSVELLSFPFPGKEQLNSSIYSSSFYLHSVVHLNPLMHKISTSEVSLTSYLPPSTSSSTITIRNSSKRLIGSRFTQFDFITQKCVLYYLQWLLCGRVVNL